MSTGTTPYDFGEDSPKDLPSFDINKPSLQGDLTCEENYRHWHEGEIIASFLAFDAASRQKQTITRIFRAEFAAGCYVKFAKKVLKEGKWDPKLDMEKSRDVRLKYVKSGKNGGESPAYRKIAEVKREV